MENLNKILEEIKSKYGDYEEIDSIIEDLEHGEYINYWADQFASDEEIQDKDIAKRLYQIALVDGDVDYNSIATNIAQYLGDKDWAREIFKKALSNNDDDEKIDIANNIMEFLDDKEWVKEIYKSIENNLSSLYKYNELLESISDNLEDKEWIASLVDKILNKLENDEEFLEYADADDLANFVRIIMVQLNDETKAKKVYEFIKSKDDINRLLEAIKILRETFDEEDANEYTKLLLKNVYDNLSEGYYCEVYYFLRDDLEDKEKAEEFKNQYEKEMKKDMIEYDTCEDVFDDVEVELDENITGKLKIVIMDVGGEYAYGVIENEEKVDFIKELIEEEELCLENERDDLEVRFYECDDQLFQVYGPAITEDTRIKIISCDDEDCYEESQKFLDTNLDETSVNIFTYANPWYKKDQIKQFDNDALQFGGFSIEKGIEFPAIIEISEDEKFDLNCLYIGTTNMDETLNDDEVVTNVLYIPKDKEEKILELYEVDIDELLVDYLSDIYNDLRENKTSELEEIEKILDECTCEVLDIEGDGWSKYKHVIVRDMNDEILYDSDC